MKKTFTMIMKLLRSLDSDQTVTLGVSTGTHITGKVEEINNIMKAYYKNQINIRYELNY
jgi:hypothetical protein